MKNVLKINHAIKPYKKNIEIEGDKSLSIRWALIASQASGKSIAYNLLKSEDVINTLNCLIRLGVKVKIFKNRCEIIGVGLNGYKLVLVVGQAVVCIPKPLHLCKDFLRQL
mgnify:CR=1 FL=1